VTYAYLDSSAIVKLMRVEAETPALEVALAHLDGLLTSSVSMVEIARAAGRVGHRKLLQRVEEIREALVLVHLNDGIVRSAGQIEPPELRSLDAIHLATALSLDLDGEIAFITYDQRLSAAARKAGLSVSAPR
jgi:predicted nucleic acid-binding protein